MFADAVEFEEILGLIAFLITMAVLISAGLRDWKEREVSDEHWMIIGVFGLILLVIHSIYLTGFRWEYLCLIAGTAMILLDLFSDKEFNPLVFYLIMGILFIVPLYSNMSEDIMRAWATIPVCYAIFLGMYMFNIVRGGADAKCLIVLSMMFPMYPHFFGLPIIGVPDTVVSQVFVASISILFLAAVMTALMAVYFFAKNVKAKDYSKKMFSGYSMKLTDARSAKVWPLEDAVNGETISISIPDDSDICEIYDRLAEAGYENVRVTPMIPFIIPIAIATFVIIILGNPLFFIL